MSEVRGKTILRCFLLLLVVLFGSLAWLTVRVVQRDRASRALIAAIKRNDAQRVIAALARGADPNAREQLPTHRPFWQRLLDELLGRHVSGVGSSSLVLAVRRDLISTPPEQERSLTILQALIKSGAAVPPAPTKATSSLQWVVRKLSKIPTGPPLEEDLREEDGFHSSDLHDAAETFRAILIKYGPSARAYVGLGECRLRQDRYVEADHAFRVALLLAPGNTAAITDLRQVTPLLRVSQAISRQLSTGQKVFCVRAYPVDRDRQRWAVLYGQRVYDEADRYYDYHNVHLDLFAENDDEYHRIWQSGALHYVWQSCGEFNEIQMCIFPMSGNKIPEIFVHEVSFGLDCEPSHLDMFAWRQSRLSHILALDSSEPLVIEDLNHDHRYQVRNIYEIGTTMSHAEQPRWSDVYDYEHGRYVLADQRFPQEFAYWTHGLETLLKQYPKDYEILRYLALAYRIEGQLKPARRAYRQAEKLYEQALRTASDRDERADLIQQLEAMRREQKSLHPVVSRRRSEQPLRAFLDYRT